MRQHGQAVFSGASDKGEGGGTAGRMAALGGGAASCEGRQAPPATTPGFGGGGAEGCGAWGGDGAVRQLCLLD